MATVSNQVSPDRWGAQLGAGRWVCGLSLLLLGCGSVSTSDPLALADGGAAGHDAEIEHASAGGAAAGASGSAGAAGSMVSDAGTTDAAPTIPPGCTRGAQYADPVLGIVPCPPNSPTMIGPRACPGATGTSYASICRDGNGATRDVGGNRCSTECQDQAGHAQGYDGGACVEPGMPFTGGIPVLCVADCSACPSS